MKIKIGTRGSRLALVQTRTVVDKLKNVAPEIEEDVRVIKTAGDSRRGKIVPGMFVNEINRAVLHGKIDIGVHSLKDLPTELPPKLEIASVPERRGPNDVLISRENLDLWNLPHRGFIGTNSLRRIEEVSSMRSDLRFRKIRGNIETRIRKVDEGKYDGTIMALAALERLGLEGRATQVFGLEEVVPAPGQGALAVVARKDSGLGFLKKINDARAWKEVTCERTFLKELGSGCRGGAGVIARVKGKKIRLIAVTHGGGRKLVKLSGQDPIKLVEKAGRLLCQGKST